MIAPCLRFPAGEQEASLKCLANSSLTAVFIVNALPLVPWSTQAVFANVGSPREIGQASMQRGNW